MVISIYTRSGGRCPSSYYRIYQYARSFRGKVNAHPGTGDGLYAKHMENTEAFLTELCYYASIYLRGTWNLLMDAVRPPDVLIIQRSVYLRANIPGIGILLKLALRRAGKVIWDFDDHIFAVHEITPREEKLLCAYSDVIVVTSGYLRDLLPMPCRERTVLLPTTDGDLQDFPFAQAMKKRQESYFNTVTLVWIATRGNLRYLSQIVPALDAAAKKLRERTGKKLLLACICDGALQAETHCLQVANIPWSRESARSWLGKSHIGLMPLTDSPFARGKGSFKMIQYMAAGLPVVVSAVGMNREVFGGGGIGFCIADGADAWMEAVLALSQDHTLWKKCSEASIQRWKDRYSFEDNLEKWKELIGEGEK